MQRPWLVIYAGALAAQLVALGLPGPRAARQASQPRPALPRPADPPSRRVKLLRLAPAGSDKLVHVALFAAPTFAGLRAGLDPLLVVGSQLIAAPATELAQDTVVAGRGGNIRDVGADLLGVVLGAAAGAIAGRAK
ncbi:hypothetical protein [Bowdeniella nasicola]|uniref:hypothetical protein n=1 Tax=Bowdeniella nasicola TaxID=208480 RepID=UPI0011614F8B|nr:hypothetical protein [Bowdeniella nasicola]